MREINMRAEHILLENKRELRREMLFLRVTGFGIFVCAGGAAAGLAGNKLLILPGLAGGAALLYYYLAGGLFISGRSFSLAGEGAEELPLRQTLVLRFARFCAVRSLVKFLWLNFFLMPARLIGMIAVRTLSETGNIQRVMLMTLAGAFVLLCAVGSGFYFYLSGRFYLSELLFLRCPGQRVGELLKNSALLSSGRLTEIMLFRIRNAFWAGRVRRKIRGAIFSYDLFSDRKFYKRYGLVTFREPS